MRFFSFLFFSFFLSHKSSQPILFQLRPTVNQISRIQTLVRLRWTRYLQLNAPIGRTWGWYQTTNSSVKAELGQTTRWPPAAPLHTLSPRCASQPPPSRTYLPTNLRPTTPACPTDERVVLQERVPRQFFPNVWPFEILAGLTWKAYSVLPFRCMGSLKITNIRDRGSNVSFSLFLSLSFFFIFNYFTRRLNNCFDGNTRVTAATG